MARKQPRRAVRHSGKRCSTAIPVSRFPPASSSKAWWGCRTSTHSPKVDAHTQLALVRLALLHALRHGLHARVRLRVQHSALRRARAPDAARATLDVPRASRGRPARVDRRGVLRRRCGVGRGWSTRSGRVRERRVRAGRGGVDVQSRLASAGRGRGWSREGRVRWGWVGVVGKRGWLRVGLVRRRGLAEGTAGGCGRRRTRGGAAAAGWARG